MDSLWWNLEFLVPEPLTRVQKALRERCVSPCWCLGRRTRLGDLTCAPSFCHNCPAVLQQAGNHNYHLTLFHFREVYLPESSPVTRSCSRTGDTLLPKHRAAYQSAQLTAACPVCTWCGHSPDFSQHSALAWKFSSKLHCLQHADMVIPLVLVTHGDQCPLL